MTDPYAEKGAFPVIEQSNVTKGGGSERGTLSPTRCALAACGMLLAVGIPLASALPAPPWEVSNRSGQWHARVSLPRAVTLLLRGTSPSSDVYEVVTLTASEGARMIGWGSNISNVRIIAEAVPGVFALKEPSCGEGLSVDLGPVSQLARDSRARIEDSEITTAPGATAAATAAAAEMRPYADVVIQRAILATQDPYLDDLERSNPAAAAQERERREINAFLTYGGEEAMVSSAERQEREHQWAQEADLLRPIVGTLRDLKQKLENRSRLETSLEAAGRKFGEEACRSNELRGLASPQRLLARRTCQEPAATMDFLVVSSPAGTPSRGALIANLKFDGGTTARYPMFPLKGSSAWVATIFWPTNASSAQVAVAQPGDGKSFSCGMIRSNRKTFDQGAKNVDAALRKAEKKLKEAEWLAKGGSVTNSGVVIN